jgi:hypothetical protein
VFDEEEFFYKRTRVVVVLKTCFKNTQKPTILIKKKVRTVQHWSQPTTLQHFKGGVLVKS